MQLIYLAAGRGSRLGKAYSTKPKCFAVVNKKKIIDYNEYFFSKFEKIFIVTGYKSYFIKQKFKNKKKYKIIFNKNFKKTNMVHSMFLTKKFITEDVVICYGDIIFNQSIIYKQFLKYNATIMPLFTNWYKYWLKRMNKKKIYLDAENVMTKNNFIESIGTKIDKKIPTFQFMGLSKFKLKDFKKLSLFYKKKNSLKIDFTNFINLSIREKIIKMRYFKYRNLWLENDTRKDLKINTNIIAKSKKW